MKLNWKRIVALALCLCLVGACALADGNNQTLYNNSADYESMTSAEWNARESFSNSIAAVGDTAYLLGKSALWTWKSGESELQKLDAAVANSNYFNSHNSEDWPEGVTEKGLFVNDIASDGKVLYGVDTSDMYNDTAAGIKVYELLDESGAFTGKLISTLIVSNSEGDSYFDTNSICIADGKVYFSRVSYETGWSAYTLYQFDLAAGGEGTPLKADSKFVTAVTPYKDGKLLARIFDEEHSWDDKTQTQTYPSCAVLDPATGAVEPLYSGASSYNACGFTYLPWQDAIAFYDGARVRMWHAGDTEAAVAAYLPSEMYDTGRVMAVLTSDVLVYGYDGSVITRELDTALDTSAVLSIYGGWGDTPHNKFVLNHPEILTTNASEYYQSTEELTSAMVSGAGVDVLQMDSGYSPVTQLIDKGYALCLSDDPAIAEIAAKMYPCLTEPFTRDGKLYAVPINMYCDGLGVNQNVMEQLGLTLDDIPTNLYDLLDLLENWEADYGDEFSDIVPFSEMSLKSSMVYRIMNMYVAYATKQGGQLSFDTDLFRKLMEKLEKIDFSTISQDYDETNEAANDEWWSKDSLFYYSGDVTSPRYYTDNKPIVLALDKGLDPVAEVNPTVLMINPKSAHVEQAVQYVAEYLQNLDDYNTKYAFFPDMNEPTVDPHYEEYLKDWQDSLAQAKTSLDTADPSEKKDMENYIEYLQKRIDNPDESRYIVSAANIALYREQVAPYLFVTGKTVLNTYDKDGNNEFYTQQEMYLDGALTLDQFIKEIDKRVRMMQLEDQ